MRRSIPVAVLPFILSGTGVVALGGDARTDASWRPLPLIKDGGVDPSWTQIGWGCFAIDNGSLRTECDPRGMGLLLYTKERFGNCQLRIVYKCKDARSNAGVFVRIDDGILRRLKEKSAPVERNREGGLLEGQLKKLMDASEQETGAWYPVHHGYEVQICDEADEYHRTGSIYSLAKAAPVPKKAPGEWRTMVITLQADLVLVEIDGQRVTHFDPVAPETPHERKWYEPKREGKRPQSGYIGLQNHDPGDVVYFRDVSVRSLDTGR